MMQESHRPLYILSRSRRRYIPRPSHAFSHLHSHDPDLRTSFYNRFRKSRESFGLSRERQVLSLLDGENEWKRLDKPWFKRDSLTGVIYQRSHPTRLSPDGRVTVCIPHGLAFVVAVSHGGFNDLCLLTWQTADVPCRLGTYTIARDLRKGAKASRRRLKDRFEVYGNR